ncbi:MAG: twin-arginine translocation pathway signal protein, partial [Planctomycetota bacterium]
TFFFQYQKYSAVRQGKYKLLRTKPDQSFMLFDLEQDLGETTDLTDKHPEVAAQLKRAYETWERETTSE